MKLSNLHGLHIRFVKHGSPAYKAGLRKGDSIVSVNGERVNDGLEFGFFSAQSRATIHAMRGNARIVCTMLRPSGKAAGVLFREKPILRCGNRCIFCFIDQMPPGFRKSLYVKDEDYRHSFTNGNYITLSHTPRSRLLRIARLGLSPLYVSVHASDSKVRRRMLGNPIAFDIMKQLRFFERHSVRFHTQVVVCPGINDGRVLRKTIQDLLTLKSGLLSIAVVPVGLTRHRKTPLVPVNRIDALRICREVSRISDRRAAVEGRRRVFCADEFFIKAKLPIPPKKYYEDYPQIENGVGLVRRILEEWRMIKEESTPLRTSVVKIGPHYLRGSCLVITSQSAFSFIRKIVDEMKNIYSDCGIDVDYVPNSFFGETVTVAGLMTARDVIRTVKSIGSRYRCVFLPKVMFNNRGYTLDGYSKQRIGKALGFPIKVVATLKELVFVVGS